MPARGGSLAVAARALLLAASAGAAAGYMSAIRGEAQMPSRGAELPPEFTELLEHGGDSEQHDHNELRQQLSSEVQLQAVRTQRAEEPARGMGPLSRERRRRTQERILPAGSEAKDGWAALLADDPNVAAWVLADPQGGLYTGAAGGATGTCTDPSALNYNQPGQSACDYDCEALLNAHFGAGASDKNRCFKYDVASGSWPAELVDRKRPHQDWWELLEKSSDGAQPGTFSFTVGEGRRCTNVTVSSSVDEFGQPASACTDTEDVSGCEAAFAASEPNTTADACHAHNAGCLYTESASETMCLFDGVHDLTHTHFFNHNEMEFQQLDDEFELGACTDILIRVETTVEPAGQSTWELNDGGLHGPWNHTCGPDSTVDGISNDCTGTKEYFMCLYDNEFTLRRTTADDGWEGSVSVHTMVTDNTIDIPLDENWLIQGHSINGVPVELDARLASGNPWALTNASIVLRHVRFSGQPGTLDPYMTGGPRDSTRGYSQRPYARQGGVLYYEGGFNSAITLDHVLMDHNGAISGSGGCIMIAGRCELQTPESCAYGLSADDIAERVAASPAEGVWVSAANPEIAWQIQPGSSGYEAGMSEASAYPPSTASGCGIRVTILHSSFWANVGYVSGVLRAINIQPITQLFDSNRWVDNAAIAANDYGFWYYANVPAKFGATAYTVLNEWSGRTTPFEGFPDGMCADSRTKNPYGGLWCEKGFVAGVCFASFAGSGQHPTEPASWSVVVDGMEMANVRQWYNTMGVLLHRDSDGEMSVVMNSTNMHDNIGTSGRSELQSGFAVLAPATGANPGVYRVAHGIWKDNGIAVQTERYSIAEYGHLDIYTGWGQQTLVEFSSFSGGSAKMAGALKLAGAGDFTIFQCVFEANVAFEKGGAIWFASARPGHSTRLAVLNSVFSSNSIQVRGAPTRGVFVRLFTGMRGVGEDGRCDCGPDYTTSGRCGCLGLPLFKIDGEEPATVCRGRPASAACVDGDVPDNEVVFGANGTADTPYYRQGESYAEPVQLSPGNHTLWYGVRAMSSASALAGWRGGWIDIVGLVPPIFPIFRDYRSEPDAGNLNGVSQEALDRGYATYATARGCSRFTSVCPAGITLWRKVSFEVPFGEGAAICSTSIGAVIQITDSTFSGNRAGDGTVLKAVGAATVRIKDSQQHPLETVSSTVALDGCSVGACDLGRQCTTSGTGAAGFFCDEDCAVNEYGDGTACQACPAGKQPGCSGSPCGDDALPSSRTSCVDCGPSEVSTRGLCAACPYGKHPDESHIGCVSCLDGLKLSSDGSRCEACPAGKTASLDGSGCASCFFTGENFYSADAGLCEPCAAGMQPNSNRTSCVPCPRGKAATATSICTACDPGTEPQQPAATSCVTCVAGTQSSDGTECNACQPGTQPDQFQSGCESCMAFDNTISASGVACVDCPARQQPNRNRTACDCRTGTYDIELFGRVLCQGIGERGDLDKCVECPPCLICDSAQTSLSPGWAFFGMGQAYECPAVGDNGDVVGCPGGPLDNVSTALAAWQEEPYTLAALESQCDVANGYTGPICGSCAAEWSHMKVGKPCEWCDDGRVNVTNLMGLIIVLLVGGSLVVSGAVKVMTDYGIVTDIRLIVGFYQILSQMGNVIDIEFPRPVPELQELVKVLFLDLRSVIKMDCWEVGGFYGKLTTNLAVVPLLYVSGCIFYYVFQKKGIGEVIAAGAADESAYVTARVRLQQNLMVGIFLLYPTITTTLFRVPMCRELGDRYFHEDDYNVECVGEFLGVVSFSFVMIALVPVGVPLVFFLKMKSAKDAIGGARMTALGGAKLSGDDVKDEDDQYGFLVCDFKPEYWYYEIVTYARKLLLGGISIAVGRGTMAQAYFVVFIEAIFLMHHMRSYPYINEKHNVVDGFGHAGLMLTYTVTLILRHSQNDSSVWAEEWFPKEGYGYLIVFLYVVLLPSPSVYYYFADKRNGKAGEESEFGAAGQFNNPLAPDTESPTFGDAGASGAGAPAFSRTSLARIHRNARETAAENAVLVKQVDALSAENEQLRVSAIAGGAAPSTAAQAAANDSEQAPPVQEAAALVDPQISQMRALAEDELLSEENRGAAKGALEARVSSTIELQNLESKSHFKRKMLEAEARVEMADWLAQHRLSNCATHVVRLAGP
eukprot:COSAG04_NODE_866_length_9767_cov_2.846400_1_plen_2137_part_00